MSVVLVEYSLVILQSLLVVIEQYSKWFRITVVLQLAHRSLLMNAAAVS